MTHFKPLRSLLFFLGACFGPVSPLLAQVETETIEEGGHLIRIILGADPVVKAVLVLLVGMSVFSWAIIIYKYRHIHQGQQQSQRFLKIFRRSRDLDNLLAKTALPPNPIQTIFRKGLADSLHPTQKGAGGPPKLDEVRRNLDRAADDELEHMERYIPFLATTGSSAPYIGLFGTVWGILAAFWEIGKSGSSSLAVVGPYIAEALIATALGLAAAIPAVIFYNFFVTRIKTFTRSAELFRNDLLERLAREYS